MREVMTKSMARNIFYGGSLFFIIIFVALAVHSHRYIVTTSTDRAGLTESVAAGKHIWEKHACINCHTILGEGAYYALLGKKYLWNNHHPHKARENLLKTLAIHPLRSNNYLLLLLSFLPGKALGFMYRSVKITFVKKFTYGR